MDSPEIALIYCNVYMPQFFTCDRGSGAVPSAAHFIGGLQRAESKQNVGIDLLSLLRVCMPSTTTVETY